MICCVLPDQTYIEVHVSVVKGYKIGQNEASIVFPPSCKFLLFAKSVDSYIPSDLSNEVSIVTTPSTLADIDDDETTVTEQPPTNQLWN